MEGKVAAIILMNNEKKFLLYLRDNKPEIPYPDTWALLGGHVEENEEPVEALNRELKEEINQVIKNPIFIDNLDDGVGNNVFIYTGFVDFKIKDLKLNEGTELKYFNFEEIMMLEKVPKPLKDFFKDNKTNIFEKLSIE
jgi:8-oxo-dGTP diphosphatase